MKQQLRIMKNLAFFGALFIFFAPSFAFAYKGAPVALTDLPTFITEKDVQANGHANPNEMNDTYEWFEWGIVGRSDVYETTHEHLWGGSWQVDTSAKLVGLAPATQYFYRQIAENARGRDAGQTVYVTTKPLPSEAQPFAVTVTNDAIYVSEMSATLRGYVSPHGNSGTKTWFEWGTTPSVENATSQQGSWGESGIVEARLDGLRPGTLYYFRTVSENNEGRSFGSLRVFSTNGFAAKSGEAPRSQNIPSPVGSFQDGAYRTGETGNLPAADPNNLPQARNRPGDFFSMLFGQHAAPSNNAETSQTGGDGTQEVAAVGAAIPSSDFSSLLSGKGAIEVVYGKIGPKNIPLHTPVEYRIAYAYRQDVPVDAKLKIVLPGEVIYIGDNTNNELLLQAGAMSERTYVLPLGRIAQGSTRTISVMGMTTGDAQGFPNITVQLEYTDTTGAHIVSGVLRGFIDAKQNVASVASVANTQGGILPSTLLGWIVYTLVVIGAVIGVRKTKEYYIKKKTLSAKADVLPPEGEEEVQTEEPPAIGEPPPFLPGAREVIPIRA